MVSLSYDGAMVTPLGEGVVRFRRFDWFIICTPSVTSGAWYPYLGKASILVDFKLLLLFVYFFLITLRSSAKFCHHSFLFGTFTEYPQLLQTLILLVNAISTVVDNSCLIKSYFAL